MRVEFLFDFGSPNAYLAHRVIPAIEQRTGVRFDYVPVLLGGIFKLTNNQSPVVAFSHIRNKPEYERLEMLRFIRRHRLGEFVFNPHFPVNTLLLMRGAIAAERHKILPRYTDVVFRALWEDGLKMDDPAIAHDALAAAALDADTLLREAQSPPLKEQLIRNTESAVERGAFGVPTFFVDGEIYFGKDRLGAVEAAIAGDSGGSVSRL